MTEHGASDISGQCNTINELKVCVHYRGGEGGEGPLYHLLGENLPAAKIEKTCPETECCKMHCDNKEFQCSQRSYSFSKDLFNFPFSAVACSDNISQNTMLLLFHNVSLPLAPPPLLWSKWLRETALMNVVNEVLKGTFPAP